jgi:purine-binding chemotaxis protein CheW
VIADTAGGQPPVSVGLLHLAGAEVALPLSALREVVACPDRLAPLPVEQVGLLGALDLRGLVLPVVDLTAVLGRPSSRAERRVVVVVGHGGHLVGLLADAVGGILAVRQEALTTLTVAGTRLPRLSPSAFAHPDDGRLVSLLDAAALLALPGMPTAVDPGPRTSGPGRVARGAGTATVVRCGPHRLALDVAAVHTTLSRAPVHRSVLDSALCRGVTEVAGRVVPVVDPLVLLGLPPLGDGEDADGLVLDLGAGLVVLAVSRLLDLAVLAASDVLPVPAVAQDQRSFVAGVAQSEGELPCLVLDGPALLRAPELVALAALNTDAAAAAGAGEREEQHVSAGAPRYLTYEAGERCASLLDQVSEVLPLPEDLVPAPTSTGTPGLLGLMLHLGSAVPVLCLATLRGRTPAPTGPATCLLLVPAAAGRVAFRVDALVDIEPLRWEQPDTGGRSAAAGASRPRLLQLTGTERLLPEVDLVGTGTALCGGRRTA